MSMIYRGFFKCSLPQLHSSSCISRTTKCPACSRLLISEMIGVKRRD